MKAQPEEIAQARRDYLGYLATVVAESKLREARVLIGQAANELKEATRFGARPSPAIRDLVDTYAERIEDTGRQVYATVESLSNFQSLLSLAIGRENPTLGPEDWASVGSTTTSASGDRTDERRS